MRVDMGTLRSVLAGLWRALDGLRKFLHLLILLALLGFVIGALKVAVPNVADKTALVIAPEGRLVEQLSGDPLTRALAQARGQGRAETLLWDLIDSIRAGAKDRRVRVLVLDLDDFDAAGGQPTLEELARAI